jgi:hypothetical protein
LVVIDAKDRFLLKHLPVSLANLLKPRAGVAHLTWVEDERR